MYMNNKSTSNSFGLVNQTGWTRPKAFKNNRNNQQWKIPTDNNEAHELNGTEKSKQQQRGGVERIQQINEHQSTRKKQKVAERYVYIYVCVYELCVFLSWTHMQRNTHLK